MTKVIKMEEKGRNLLVDLSIHCKGDWSAIFEKIKNKDIPPHYNVPLGVGAITLLDAEYPECLKNSFQPPFVLFYKGNIDLLKNKNIVYVYASKNLSDGGKNDINNIVKKLDCIIVDGNFNKYKGLCDKTIYLSNDCSMKLPNKKSLIISEHIDKCNDNVNLTSRVACGLCNKMLVIESRKKNNPAVNRALMCGKDIYVVPKKFGSKYANNSLISFGASILESVGDLDECEK